MYDVADIEIFPGEKNNYFEKIHLFSCTVGYNAFQETTIITKIVLI